LDEELANTRAKANLLRNYIGGVFDKEAQFDIEQFRKILGLCVNCKMCSVECPAGVDMSKLIVEARAKLAKYSGFSVTEYALSNNRWMSILASAFAPLSNSILSYPAVRWLLEKTMGFDRNRLMPVFQRGSFLHKARRALRQTGPLKNPADKVVFFIDSYIRYNDHDLGLALIKVLRQCNIDLVIPPQRPAPLPAYVYGNIKHARRDMRYNLKFLAPLVQQGYKILCTEPSAAMFLKEELPLLFDTPQARDVSAAAAEVMEYLNQPQYKAAIRTQKPIQQNRLAYHAPCHLKSLNGAKSSLAILSGLGFSVTDLNNSCCGLAGTAGMQAKNRKLCDDIGGFLKASIQKHNPDVIITECAACKMQIEHLTGKPVLHPLTLLAAQLD
jgi:Fe-S oxidoreductase